MASPDVALPDPGRPLAVGAQHTAILVPADGHAEEFRRQRVIVCGDLLEADLLAAVLQRCRTGQFVPDVVAGLGAREVESPSRAGAALNIALSRAPLLRWVEAATGRDGLARVEGRVVQTRANGIDGLEWHDDLNVPARKLGITINLSDAPYDGGDFELRDAQSHELVTRYHHHVPGTALLFDVDAASQHRVLPVGSGGPRRVFTGWFLQEAAAR